MYQFESSIPPTILMVSFFIQVENVVKQLRKVLPSDGLLPIFVSPDSGQPTHSKITFGAMGDRYG